MAALTGIGVSSITSTRYLRSSWLLRWTLAVEGAKAFLTGITFYPEKQDLLSILALLPLIVLGGLSYITLGISEPANNSTYSLLELKNSRDDRANKFRYLLGKILASVIPLFSVIAPGSASSSIYNPAITVKLIKTKVTPIICYKNLRQRPRFKGTQAL